MFSLVRHCPGYLHSIGEHPGESEGNLLRELLSSHGHFEAVSEVNVQYPSSQSVQHQVGWMPTHEIKLVMTNTLD